MQCEALLQKQKDWVNKNLAKLFKVSFKLKGRNFHGRGHEPHQLQARPLQIPVFIRLNSLDYERYAGRRSGRLIKDPLQRQAQRNLHHRVQIKKRESVAK